MIFDEPTGVLAPHEAEGLFRIFSELKEDGYAILFITHKMREVMAVADRATVLRHGKVVGTLEREELSPDLMVSMMLDIDVPESPQSERKGLSVASESIPKV